MRTTARNLVPPGALIALGTLLVVSFLAVALARLAGIGTRQPDAEALSMRELRFEDTVDGAVAVIDARSGVRIETVTGEQGFLRGTLRGLARERKRRDLDAGPAFQLIARADGRLTLADPATGQRIDLESFGPTNAAVFARWVH
jgi:putative photosynthetic complex assembly protein